MKNYLVKFIILSLFWALLAVSCCEDVKTFSMDLLAVKSVALNDGVEAMDKEEIQFESFWLGVRFETSEPVQIASGISMMQSAYAFSCPWDRYVPSSAPQRIEVRSLFKYNESYGPGEILPLENRPDNEFFYYEEQNPEWEYFDWIKLAAIPAVGSLQQFTVDIHLDDGSVLSDTTHAVILN